MAIIFSYHQNNHLQQNRYNFITYNRLKIIMGEVISCCNADLFEQLTKRYGQTFTKLILAEKSKQYLLQHFQQLVLKFKDIFKHFEEKVTDIVTSRKGQLHNVYSKLKAEVNNKVPGGIELFEKVKGESIDEFSGYNKLQSQVDDIKITTLGKIDSEKDIVLSSVDVAKSKMVSKIDEQRPKIEYYDSLPPQMQKMLRLQAQKYLAKELEQNKTQIAKTVAQQFNPENTLSILGKFNPDQQLGGIVGQASKLLSAALGQISPGSGGIGGIIQSGLHFLGA